MVRAVLRGGQELLACTDPLDAELWASHMLGTFYKLPVPPDAQQELEAVLRPAVVQGALAAADPPALAVLRALAAVAPPPLGPDAAAAAAQLAGQGVAEPPWGQEIGTAALVDAWSTTDPFGDQIGYYLTYRYEGRPDHMLVVLYDENLGGIIKDAFAGSLHSNLRDRLEEEGATILPTNIQEMAGRILNAVATGDHFIDNAWTQEFKNTRTLPLSRMARLEPAPYREPEFVSDAQRKALLEEFLASPFATSHPNADIIADCCIDFAATDPLRWSPMVVEAFLLDFLPRQVSLSMAEIKAVPDVVSGWVRFALGKKGLARDLIEETVAVVGNYAPEFRDAATNPAHFGPAKSVANLMKSAGVNIADAAAVQAWMEDFNNRPFDERDQILGSLPLPFPEQ